MPIVYFLFIYIPLETFLLKFLPVSEFYYQLARQLPDFLIFSLFIFLIITRLQNGTKIVTSVIRLDLFVVFFIYISCIGVFFTNEANIGVVFLKFKAIFRYVFLCIIILNLRPTNRQVNLFLNLFVFSAIFQIFVGFIQYVGGIAVRDFLAARNADVVVLGYKKTFTGDRFEDVNDIMGMLGDTISYSFLLLILHFIILSIRTKKSIHYILIFLNAVFIFLSGSLSSLLAILVSTIISDGLTRITFFKVVFGTATSVISLFFLLPVNLLNELLQLSELVYAGAMNSRLGLILYGIPEYLTDLRVLVGYSLDKFIFADYLRNATELPPILSSIVHYIIDDVYWFAIFIYFGVPGGVIYCFIFVKILIWTRKVPFIYFNTVLGEVNLSKFIFISTLMIFLLNLFNQAVEVRSFSLFYWSFVAVFLYVVKLRRDTVGN